MVGFTLLILANQVWLKCDWKSPELFTSVLGIQA